MIDAAINQGVRRILALSTDKAVNPDQLVRRDQAVRGEDVRAGQCVCRDAAIRDSAAPATATSWAAAAA